MSEPRPTALGRLRAHAGTIRVRTTIAAVAVVGVALLSSAIALVFAMRHILIRETRSTAILRAHDLAGELEAGASARQITTGNDDDLLVQVLDPAGRVLASSEHLAGAPAVGVLRPGDSTTVHLPAVDDHPFILAAATAGSGDGRLTVVTGRNLEPVDEATRVVTGLLVLGLPVLLLVVAATTWKVVGGTLAPVESIRREVDEISAAELHRRVPNPPGADEVARLAATMNEMLDRLEHAQARQQRLISDASHELRSPVAAIRQHAEVALAHPDRTTVGELAGTVLAEDLRVQVLVDDLLLLARADEHTLKLHRRPVDLDDLVFEEAGRIRARASAGVDTTGVSAGRIQGDIALLRRVVRNLADNAARHARSRVAFALTERDGLVVLDVDDDGPGIPAADRATVFERFVRLDDARARDAGGGGLGLAIVSEVVLAHDGTVAISDSPLGGARFELRFPAVADGGE